MKKSGCIGLGRLKRPRYTKDMDILVEPALENGQRIVAALKEFGFAGLRLTQEDFIQPGRFVQLGYEPLCVDLLTSIEGFTFEQVWKQRVRGRYGRLRAYFIGRDELIRNQELSDCRQDQVDVERLRPRKSRGLPRRTREG